MRIRRQMPPTSQGLDCVIADAACGSIPDFAALNPGYGIADPSALSASFMLAAHHQPWCAGRVRSETIAWRSVQHSSDASNCSEARGRRLAGDLDTIDATMTDDPHRSEVASMVGGDQPRRLPMRLSSRSRPARLRFRRHGDDDSHRARSGTMHWRRTSDERASPIRRPSTADAGLPRTMPHGLAVASSWSDGQSHEHIAGDRTGRRTRADHVDLRVVR